MAELKSFRSSGCSNHCGYGICCCRKVIYSQVAANIHFSLILQIGNIVEVNSRIKLGRTLHIHCTFGKGVVLTVIVYIDIGKICDTASQIIYNRSTWKNVDGASTACRPEITQTYICRFGKIDGAISELELHVG